MAIEPISSAMSYVAPQIKPVEKTEKSADNNMDVAAAPTQNEYVDAYTQVVQSPEGKSGEGEDNAGNRQDPERDNKNNSRIKKAVEELNKKMANSEAIFGIHEETQRVTIKIIDKESKEVIKEFPPEKTLDMIAKVWEVAGIMVDEKR